MYHSAPWPSRAYARKAKSCQSSPARWQALQHIHENWAPLDERLSSSSMIEPCSMTMEPWSKLFFLQIFPLNDIKGGGISHFIHSLKIWNQSSSHTHIPALLQTLVGLKPYRLYPIPTLHIYFKDECWKYDLCHSFNAFSDRHLHHFCTWRASVVESRKKELRVQALPKWRLLHRQGQVGKRISLQLPRPIHWTLVRVSYKISGELRFPSSWQLS